MNLQEYLKSINPKSDIVIYGSKYHCWRDDGYLGIFVWTKDEFVGDSFQREVDGKVEVAIPTKIELVRKDLK